MRERRAHTAPDNSPTSSPAPARPPTKGDHRAVVLLGGGSEMGMAIVRELVAGGARTVVLAGRREEAMLREAADLQERARIETVAFDGGDYTSHAGALEEAFRRAGPEGVQAVVLAFGILGDTETYEANPALAGGMATVNFAGGVTASLAAARALERQEHPGALVVLSSLAVWRPTVNNYIYGATKAGLDHFARGLGESYRRRGVQVLVVRPGFVRTKMTQHLPRRPREATPEQVARDAVRALRRGKSVCQTPRSMSLLRPLVGIAPSWLLNRILRAR